MGYFIDLLLMVDIEIMKIERNIRLLLLLISGRQIVKNLIAKNLIFKY